MKEQIRKYIEKNELFSQGDKIVVGVSGGADSVCLLHLLRAWQKEWELSLYVVHIHHGIRGREADADAVFVEGLAKQLSLPFFLVEGKVPCMAAELGIGEEEAGRRFRYEELERIRQEQGADWIAVAHHRDDQAETVLFRLFRGSGVRGLAGMAPKRDRIIRPLLFAGRKEIEAYLRQQGMDWREDSTNQEFAYSRNRIRGQILPMVEEQINSQAGRHIAEVAADVARWRDFLASKAAQAAEEVLVTKEGEEYLLLEPFAGQDEVVQEELIRLFITRGIPEAKDVTRVHYEKLRELVRQGAGKRLNLPCGMTVERCYDSLRLFCDNKKESPFEPVFITCQVPSVNIVEMDRAAYRITLEVKNREELAVKIPEKDYTKWFDYDKINNGLALRNPREGDFFVMDEQGHRKKLARYYMDQKIARELRDRQLVLADGSHILWVIPGRISEDYKINKNTKRVLVVTKERIRHEGRDQGID